MVQFDPSWEFHTKTYAMDWNGKLVMSGDFQGFPGMRFVEERFYQRHKGYDLDTCSQDCKDDQKCKAFSYNQDSMECQMSDGGLRYAPGFTYYERNQPVKGHKGKFVHFPAPELEHDKIARLEEEASMKREAKAAKKVRKEREHKAYLAELEQKAVRARVARVAKEAQDKQEQTRERAAKVEARKQRVAKASEAALQRGEYAESVFKSQESVQTAKKRLDKEQAGKKSLSRYQADKKTNERHQKEHTALAQRQELKQSSEIRSSTAESQQENAKLQMLQALRIMQLEGYKLARSERWMKTGLLPKSVQSLIDEEKILRAKEARQKKEIRINTAKLDGQARAEKLLAKNEVMKREEADRDQQRELQLTLLKQKGAKEISEARAAVASESPNALDLKKKALEALDAEQRATLEANNPAN